MPDIVECVAVGVDEAVPVQMPGVTDSSRAALEVKQCLLQQRVLRAILAKVPTRRGKILIDEDESARIDSGDIKVVATGIVIAVFLRRRTCSQHPNLNVVSRSGSNGQH